MRTRSRSAEALSVIIVSLVCSAAMRTISATAEGLPDELNPILQVGERLDDEPVSPVAALGVSKDPGTYAPENVGATEEDQTYRGAIRERESALARREDELALREAELAALEKRLETRIVELEASRAALSEALMQAEAAQRKDLAHLIQVYEGMKAKKAGEIFDQMEPEFAAGFLGAMRSDRAASVMSNMAPDHAYAISVILASRNAEPAQKPKE